MNQSNKKSSGGLLRSSAIMAVATFASRVLGLVRERVLAVYFGASGVTDAFYVACRIPNMLRDLFAESVFSSAFVPVFTEARQKDEALARSLLWSSFVLLGGLTLILSILTIIFAPEIVGFMTPSFLEHPDKFQVTVMLTRIMAPFLTLVSLAALFMGALNTLKVFFVPSLAPALYNLLMILSIVGTYSVMENSGHPPILSAALGVMIGGLGQMLIQVPLLIKKNYGPQGPIVLFSSFTKRIVNRLGIGTVGVAATQINLLINTILASSSAVGAVSWLQYSFRLFQFPVGILGVSLAGSNLVHFSAAWKQGDKQQAKNYLSTSYLLCWLVMIPSMALLLAMGDESIHLLLESGKFDRYATIQSGLALKMYVLGLPCYGLYKIFGPVFFTLDRPKIPIFISIFSISLNILFCVLFTPIFGFSILALGVSLSMIVNSALQAFILKRHLELDLNFFINRRVVTFLVGGLVTYFASRVVMSSFFSYEASLGSKLTFFLLAGLLGTVGYLASILLGGEYKMLRQFMAGRKAR